MSGVTRRQLRTPLRKEWSMRSPARLVVILLLASLILLGGPFRAAAQNATPAAVGPGASPAPGRSLEGTFDVGGRRLFLSCTGTGSPTVVLEAAGTTDSSTWGPIWVDIAGATRVCRYDRAGLGRSDPAPAGVRTVQDSVDDLHALLDEAGVPGPYVLAGHSVGGLVVRLYASIYPEDVAGLVLIDGQPPDLAAPGLALLPAEQQQ